MTFSFLWLIKIKLKKCWQEIDHSLRNFASSLCNFALGLLNISREAEVQNY